MEVSTEQNPQPETTKPSNADEEAPHHQNPPSQLPNINGGTGPEHKFSAEEVRGVLQVIASTGRFWNDWNELRSMLSFQLKQVLSDYPEAKVADDLVKSSLGETYLDLVERMDEALLNFPEGPPFTLQRLCEILLDARAIYPVLSKLVLALEKNLLVTTTLSKSMDPHPLSVEHQTDAPTEEDNKPHSNAMDNGTEPSVEDRDEVMEEAEVQNDMTVHTENSGGNISSSENFSQPANDS